MCVCLCVCAYHFFFFFKQKTAYEMRISDWSSDVCSSDLFIPAGRTKEAAKAGYAVGVGKGNAIAIIGIAHGAEFIHSKRPPSQTGTFQIGRASCRESVCQYV